MRKMPNVHWWSAMGSRKDDSGPEHVDTDYADMGTAFGLDASLALPEEDSDDPRPGRDVTPRR